MAYRRSVTTKAKLFYQQQRFSPSFSHIQRDDDQKNSDPSLTNTKIFSSPQYSCLSNRVGVGRIGNSVLDRRFCAQQFMLPMTLGAFGIRNMSTSVGEGVDQSKFMSDVADVLTDTAVEAVASQASVVNEVAVAAADSYFPVAALQYFIDYVHCFTGLNWWTSIIATSLMIRLLTLPLNINQLKATSRLTLLRPKLEEIREDMENRGLSPSAVNDGQQRMKELFKEYKVTPFTALKGILIQGPIFVCFFLAISNMAEKVPSFKEGGTFWFTDLATPDSMYILPILTALTFLITVECNAQEGMEGNPIGPTIKNVSRFFAALTIPLTATFPKAIFMYWITSNVFSLAYGLVLKNPEVKKRLGIPIIPPTEPVKKPWPKLSFSGTVVKYTTAAQLQEEEEEAQSSATDASKTYDSKNTNIIDSQSKDQKLTETGER